MRTTVEVGAPAVDFTLPGTDGEETTHYSLADALESGPVVLVFYPFDFSPVCASQLCTFRDAEWLTVAEGVDVWGVSPDSVYCHGKFIEEFDLTFPLLTDRLADVAEEYGLRMDEFEHHEAIPRRAIVAVDSTQTVRYVWEPEDQYQSPERTDIDRAIDWYR